MTQNINYRRQLSFATSAMHEYESSFSDTDIQALVEWFSHHTIVQYDSWRDENAKLILQVHELAAIGVSDLRGRCQDICSELNVLDEALLIRFAVLLRCVETFSLLTPLIESGLLETEYDPKGQIHELSEVFRDIYWKSDFPYWPFSDVAPSPFD